MKALLRYGLAGLWLLATGCAHLRSPGAPTLSAIPEIMRPTSSGERRLSSGHVVRYECHYDRNALRAAHVSTAGILAITKAGTLLRFDPGTLRATAELILPEAAAVCLGEDAVGRPLVGLSDGRVCRADVAGMHLEQIGRVDGRPIWVGGAREGGGGRGIVLCASEVLHKGLGDPSKVEIQVLGRGKVAEIDGPPMASFSAFLVDSKGRLWLGEDRGEWGGACHLFDPSTGKLATMAKPPEDGIYGFLETVDGRILCHGGMMHMGHLAQFVSQLEVERDGLTATLLHYRQNWQDGERVADDATCLPITQMLRGGNGAEFTVFAFNRISRVSPDFKRWKEAGTVAARLWWGRVDAVGCHSGIRQVFPRGERLEDGILCSTVRDGLIVWKNGAVIQKGAIPNQIGLEWPCGMRSSDVGLLVDDASDGLPWRWSGAGWEPLDIVPPFKPKRGDDEWSSCALRVHPDGSILTVWSGSWSPGARAVVEWRKGKPRRISEEEESSLWIESTFLTPDGGIWAADFEQFRRLVGGTWVDLHALTEWRWDLVAVNACGPPWILFGGTGEKDSLSLLSYGPAFERPTLKDLVLKDDDGTALAVRDARPWTDGRVILATDRGVRIVRPDRDVASRPDFPTPAGRVMHVCRDGRGRLWFAGEGLWLLDGGALVDLSALPMFGKNAAMGLERDPDDPDRVAVILGRYGVVLVSVAREVPPGGAPVTASVKEY